MANDAAEVLVAQQVKIYLGPAAATLPTTMTAPSASFIDLGYTSTDGFSISYEPTVEDIYAHQDLDPIRQIKTGQVSQVTFNLMQWNEYTVPLAFGGGSWSDASGVYTYSPPGTNDAIAEYTLVADISDGTKDIRLTVGRGVVANAVETSLVNNAAAVMPITLKALKPTTGKAWNLITDEGNFS